LKILCEGCEKRLWIGLWHCPSCGKRQEQLLSMGASLRIIEAPQPIPWSSVESADLFPLFGDLLLRSDPEEAMLLRPGQAPLYFSAWQGDEVIAVDRWVVIRRGDHLHILPAPLFHRGQLEHCPILEHSMPRPEETERLLERAQRLPQRQLLSSIARIDRCLAILSDQGGEVRLRVLDLNSQDPERPWSSGLKLLFEAKLPSGPWHFERGASPDGGRLLLASDREYVLLEGARRLRRYAAPAQLKLGGLIDTAFGVMLLSEEDQVWLQMEDQEPQLLEVPGVLEGLERTGEGDERSAVARIAGGRHLFNPAEFCFDPDPLYGPSCKRLELLLPGGMIYRADDRETLHLRTPIWDAALPLRSPRGLPPRACLEGPRLWILLREGPFARLHLFDGFEL